MDREAIDPVSPAVLLSGGALAGGMALATIAIVNQLASLLEWDLIRIAFEPPWSDGRAVLVTWGAGPVAAFIAGILFMPRAVAAQPLAGAWMGTATYGLATLLGAAGFELQSGPGFGLPLALFAVVALIPLLILAACIGEIWSFAIRHGNRMDRSHIHSPEPLPAGPLLIFLALAFLGWYTLAAAIVSTGPAGID